MEYHWIVVQLVRDFMLLVTASLLSRQLPYVTITLTVRRHEKRRKDCHSQISPHSLTSSLKTGQSHCDACGESYNQRQKCWEGCFFTSFFPSSPRPWPNVQQNVNICARNCSVISQH